NNITLNNVALTMRKQTQYAGGQYDKRPCRGEGFVTGPVHSVYVEQASDVRVEGLHVDWGRDAFPNKGENLFFYQPNQ
ncbi:MAG: glycoside hydrolase family 28 protein, partial [Prevotella sp.]|nr:glycoside hydrolase family 28 protein [Prevotella sp.]